MLPQEIFIIEHSGTLFPAFLEPKNQSFPGKAGVLSNCEKKNEIGQLVGERGGEMAVSL